MFLISLLKINLKMNKSIALIGGGGFIGTNLANYFSAQDYKVLVVSRSLVEKSKFTSKQIEISLIDVNHTSKLVEALSEYENIIWLVNNLVPSTSMDSLIDDFDFNVNPLIKLLESASDLEKLKRFVFISSGGTIYGDSPNRIDLTEDCEKKPISAYGLSKIISENYIEFIVKNAKFDSYILRPSNVYGSHQNLNKPQGIIGYAFNAILNNKSIDLYDEGKVIRDFIHVMDLAEAVKHCVENKRVKSKVKKYNIGSQTGYSIKEVLNLIESVSCEKLKTVSKPSRDFDCHYNVLDISKITDDLGWKPKIDLETGLAEVWQWIQSDTK